MDFDPELRQLIPPILFAIPSIEQRAEREAAILFVDVAGFTGLSEALAQLGPEGAEILERTIAEYFNGLLDVVELFAGIPVKIGGDALTVAFLGDDLDLETHVQRAVACAAALQRSLREEVVVETPKGGVRIAHKVGVGCGRLLTGLVGNPNIRLELAMGGQALDQAAAAEHHAVAGEVWASGDVVRVLGRPAWWDRADNGFKRLIVSAVQAPPPKVSRGADETKPIEPWHLTLVPPTVRESARKGTLEFLRRHQTITVLFVSFRGIDFETLDCFDALDRHYRAMQSLVEAHGGFLSEFEAGDKGAKFIVLFGAPVPIEDPVGQAVRCAAVMQERAKETGVVTDQRIGMTSGRLYVGRIGCRSLAKISALGDYMNMAARLMSAARSWSVLAESGVARRTTDRASWSQPELLQLKGKRTRVSAAYLQKIKDRAWIERRGLGVVGRLEERRKLRQVHARLIEGGGTLVRIVGEPGTGKTRLLNVVRRMVRDAGEVRLIESHDYALFPRSEPFGALTALLLDIVGIDAQLPGEARREVFRAWLAELPEDLRKTSAHLAPLLSVPWEPDPVMAQLRPEQRLRVLQDAVIDCIDHGCREINRLLIVDNAHLLDSPSRSVLDELVPALPRLRLAVVMAGRPGATWESSISPEVSGDSVVSLSLGPLSPQESTELACQFLQVNYLDSELDQFLSEKAQGNPLRIEAWLTILRDKGHLADDGDVASLTGYHHGLTIPDRLESLALVNLESLPQDAQLTLKVASVVGISFTPDDVVGLHPQRLDRSAVEKHLAMGQKARLLYFERGESARMFFNRPEVRDAFHDTLPFELRRMLHRKRVQQIKAQHHGLVDDDAWLSLAAHHVYTGDPLAQTRHFRKAADVCMDRHNHREAVGWLYKLLQVCRKRRDVGGMLSTFRRLHNELSMLGEAQEDRELLDEWVQASEAHGRHHSLVEALEVRARWSQRHGDEEAARTDLDRAIEIARIRCPERLSLVYGSLSIMYADKGRPREALEAAEKALEEADELGMEKDINLMVARGNALSALGRSAEAHEAFREVLPQLNHSDLWTRSIVEGNIAVELFNLGRFEEGHDSLVRALELKREVGDRREEAVALGNVGYSSYRIGRLEDARRYSEACIRLSRRLRYLRVEMNAAGNLGEVLWIMGEFEAAQRWYDRVETLLREIPNRHIRLEQQNRVGELELSRGHAREAKEIFARALAMSQESGVTAFELPAEEGLAQAHLDLGNPSEAWRIFKALVARAEKAPHLLPFPQRAFLRAAEAGSAAGFPDEAAVCLEHAREALEDALKQLSRESTRIRFIEAFPWNRRILDLASGPGGFNSPLPPSSTNGAKT